MMASLGMNRGLFMEKQEIDMMELENDADLTIA